MLPSLFIHEVANQSEAYARERQPNERANARKQYRASCPVEREPEHDRTVPKSPHSASHTRVFQALRMTASSTNVERISSSERTPPY